MPPDFALHRAVFLRFLELKCFIRAQILTAQRKNTAFLCLTNSIKYGILSKDCREAPYQFV